MDRKELGQVLDMVLVKVRVSKTIETEVYALMVTLFPTIIAPALDIIDNGRITRLVC